jgi:hypothetical protein
MPIGESFGLGLRWRWEMTGAGAVEDGIVVKHGVLFQFRIGSTNWRKAGLAS